MSNIKKYNTAKDTARQLALYVKQSIDNSKDKFYMAVSGGSTPKMLFNELVEVKDLIKWDKIMLFWVDERCVPPSDNESNYKMADESLLKNVPLPKENIFRMKGELSPEEGLKDYNQEIKIIPDFGGYPFFDLIILGMGDDGHTASIFPPEKLLLETPKALAIGTNPYSGQKRLTLTGPTIRNAKEIVFHVTGKNKADVLKEILEQEGKYLDYPAYYLSKQSNVSWFVDKEAIQ